MMRVAAKSKRLLSFRFSIRSMLILLTIIFIVLASDCTVPPGLYYGYKANELKEGMTRQEVEAILGSPWEEWWGPYPCVTLVYPLASLNPPFRGAQLAIHFDVDGKARRISLEQKPSG